MSSSIAHNPFSSIPFVNIDFPNNRFNNHHVVNLSQSPVWHLQKDKFSFWFEDAFVPIGLQVQDLTNRYWHLCFHISIAYIAIIFSLQYAMRKRPEFNLRKPLIMWNGLLAVFSILGTIRCLPEFLSIFYRDGFVASYTNGSYYMDYRPTVWYLFFTLSKAPELIDTLFLVLRKRPLKPIHWVHHALTLCYSWFVFPDVPATARWMVNMNFFVHSVMYTYFTATSLGYKIPSPIAFTITSMQNLQMFVGAYINYHCLVLKMSGAPVDASYSVICTGLALYGLFCILFLHFQIHRYLAPRPSKKLSKAALSNGTDINHNVDDKKQQ